MTTILQDNTTLLSAIEVAADKKLKDIDDKMAQVFGKLKDKVRHIDG